MYLFGNFEALCNWGRTIPQLVEELAMAFEVVS